MFSVVAPPPNIGCCVNKPDFARSRFTRLQHAKIPTRTAGLCTKKRENGTWLTLPVSQPCTFRPTMADPVCSNGLSGIDSSNGDVCCAPGCGQCGSSGCSQAGAPDLTANDCCVTEIADFGELCSVTGSAPCIINDGERCSVKYM